MRSKPISSPLRTIEKIIKWLVLPVVAGAMLFVPGKASAGCGSAPPLPPGCVGWTSDSGSTIVSGTSCNIEVYYCYACCNGTVYCYISEIDPTGPGPNCDFVKPQDMVYYGAAYARDQAVLKSGCAIPPCPSNTSPTVTTYMPACWTEASFSGKYEITPCSETGCYCQDDCQVCINNGVPQYNACSKSRVGSCACTSLPNDAPWVLGTCYDLGCTNLPGDH